MEVTETDATTLGCGRDMDAVWDQIQLPPDAHERGCPDCQAARADLAPLAAATTQLDEFDVEDPTLHTEPRVLERITAIARAEVRRGRQLPLRNPTPDDPSQLTISEQTVAGLVRRVADQLASLEARRCSVEVETEHNVPGAAAVLRITLRIAVSPTIVIPEVVARLRTEIVETVTREVGVQISQVRVLVEDVWHE